MMYVIRDTTGAATVKNQPNDPFRSTFSLLAGRGTTARPHYALNHIEPLPETAGLLAPKSSKTIRKVALIAQIVALLQLR
jgi:hypothetical protein